MVVVIWIDAVINVFHCDNFRFSIQLHCYYFRDKRQNVNNTDAIAASLFALLLH